MAEGKVCEREQAGCREEKVKCRCAFHQAKQSISESILILFKMGCVTPLAPQEDVCGTSESTKMVRDV